MDHSDYAERKNGANGARISSWLKFPFIVILNSLLQTKGRLGVATFQIFHACVYQKIPF